MIHNKIVCGIAKEIIFRNHSEILKENYPGFPIQILVLITFLSKKYPPLVDGLPQKNGLIKNTEWKFIIPSIYIVFIT